MNRQRQRLRWLRRSPGFIWGVVAFSAGLLVLSVIVLVQSTSEAVQSEPVGQEIELSLGPEETFRVTYVGDSLAAGLYATTEAESYRGLTTDELAGDGPFVEVGRALVGGTVDQTLTGNDEFPSNQDLYIVELGTNDINDVDFRTFNRQYEALLQQLVEASPDAALLCLGTWRPPSTGASFDLVIRQNCEAQGGVYRRLSDLEREPTFTGPADEETFEGPSDTFHPNDAGHNAIFERIMSAVEVRREG